MSKYGSRGAGKMNRRRKHEAILVNHQNAGEAVNCWQAQTVAVCRYPAWNRSHRWIPPCASRRVIRRAATKFENSVPSTVAMLAVREEV